MKTEKYKSQDCHKRSLVYETKCLTCEKKQTEYIKSLEIEDKEKEYMMENIRNYKYIGETSRSAYERGWEHTNDLAQLKSTSHMLRHIVGVHPGEDMSAVEFGMRVIKYNKSSFERQIMESVVIQNERKQHNLLNSRSEYNRCSLPRLCTQVGDSEYNKVGKELELEKLEEEKLEYKIRQLRKEKNKARLHPTRESGPSTKKRKIGNFEYISIKEIWGEPETTNPTKNKKNQETEENKKRKTENPRPTGGSSSPRKPQAGQEYKITNLRTTENTGNETEEDHRGHRNIF